jgi:hypothetical protein
MESSMALPNLFPLKIDLNIGADAKVDEQHEDPFPTPIDGDPIDFGVDIFANPVLLVNGDPFELPDL